MTKSVTVINTSNWQGEDVIVVIDGKQNRLLPGQVLKVTQGNVERIFYDEKDETKPFKTQGGIQMLPQEINSGHTWPWRIYPG